jgi:hypothetical protein
MLGTGIQAGCPGTPVLLARRPRMLTVVLTGDKRRPSGQGPGAKVSNGLSSQKTPASRAARAHPPSPARPARQVSRPPPGPALARRPRPPSPAAGQQALRARTRQPAAPQSGSDPRQMTARSPAPNSHDSATAPARKGFKGGLATADRRPAGRGRSGRRRARDARERAGIVSGHGLPPRRVA